MKFGFSKGAKFLCLFVFVALTILTLSDKASACNTYEQCLVYRFTDLIAGKTIDVGNVEVYKSYGYLIVKYTTDSGWVMTETQLHVSTSSSSIPQKNGNAIPGQFKYKQYHNPAVNSVKYKIPLTQFGCSTYLYIAAHAVVNNCDFSVPTSDTVKFEIAYGDGSSSFFNATIYDSNGLDGSYVAYCVDEYAGIFPGAEYASNVIISTDYTSSFTGFPFSHPENLGAVNYILNNYDNPGPLTYTANEIQAAIWTLLDGGYNPESFDDGSGNIEWLDETVVAQIVADAQAHNSFVPQPGDWVGIIFYNPLTSELPDQFKNGQAILIKVRIPECDEETAWAEGCNFYGSDWSMYFKFKIK